MKNISKWRVRFATKGKSKQIFTVKANDRKSAWAAIGVRGA